MDRCNLCGLPELKPIYRAKSTQRDLTVHVCLNCSLVQSLPRVDQAKSEPSLSPDATFGDIRYGKSFRAQANLDLIRRQYPKKKFNRVLDVGAGRGVFARAFLDWQSDTTYIAIEPDLNLLDNWLDIPDALFVNKRIEDFEFSRKYDLIYCSHTLEHLANPKETLKSLKGILAKNGVAFFEVPNLSIIERSDMIEEFFIDKHLYHFYSPTFYVMLTSCGLYPPHGITSDMENLTAIVEHGQKLKVPHMPSAVEWVQSAFDKYSDTLTVTNTQLTEAVVKINKLNNVVVWGGGRIYHKMLEAGLNPNIPVIDTYLDNFLKPEDIKEIKPDLVIIASRAYQKEIRAQINKLYPETQVKTWDELILTD